MKDETKNPTHTFKDRLAYEMVRPIAEAWNAKKHFHRTSFGSISYGNTAYSMGHYTRLLNAQAEEELVNSIAFVPPALRKRTFGPDTEGQCVRARLFIDTMFRHCRVCENIEIDLKKQVYRSDDLEVIARREGIVLDQFVDITEGLDRPAYVPIIIEAIERQLRKAPDYVIVPFGAGILCNEIIDYIHDHQLKTKVIPVSSGDPKTIAVMIYGPIWVDTKALLKKGSGWTRHESPDKTGRKRAPYYVYHVTDLEIRRAMRVLHKAGISAEPSGASGFGILPRLSSIDSSFDPAHHSVLVINTGNGLLNFT